MTASVATADLAHVKSAGELRWCGDLQGGEPYVFQSPDDGDRLVGFEVEIADALARRPGRAADVRPERLAAPDCRARARRLRHGDERPRGDAGAGGTRPLLAAVLPLRPELDGPPRRRRAVPRPGRPRRAPRRRRSAARLRRTSWRRAARRSCCTKAWRSRTSISSRAASTASCSTASSPRATACRARRCSKAADVGEGVYAIAFRPADEDLARRVDEALGEPVVERRAARDPRPLASLGRAAGRTRCGGNRGRPGADARLARRAALPSRRGADDRHLVRGDAARRRRRASA
jgi:hypothetical protein